MNSLDHRESMGNMHANYLDFEQPIAELETKIDALKVVDSQGDLNIEEEISRLKAKSQELTRSVFKSLSAAQIAQLARHPLRPHAKDYIQNLFEEFEELHGDRVFGDDQAVIGGIARFAAQPVVVIGQQKGRDTKEKIQRNFGMMHPEGYRRALRLMQLAEKFNLPVITLIDTPGAYPGIEAEARGQSEAIARNLRAMAQLNTPILSLVIGEGCSGGALGIGVADRVLMLQYSYYATISPEGCATILFKSATKAAEAAEIMGITADKLLSLGLIDRIVEEPLGGAHRDLPKMLETLRGVIGEELANLQKQAIAPLLAQRYERLMAIGRPS